MSQKNIAVIGSGSWGTALAITLHKKNTQHVTLWSKFEDEALAIDAARENTVFLPNIPLPEGLLVTADLSKAIQADALFLVVPAQFLRSVLQDIKTANLPETTPLVICSKGIEISTGLFMNDLVTEFFPQNPLAVLGGPNFADEIAEKRPAATTLACADPVIGKELLTIIGSETFRPYLSSDVVAVEVGSALKNVIAIACGIVMGKKMGENAKASLIARGLAEICRFGEAFGAQTESFMGLSGLGDLSLTCNSTKSRNMSLGFALGEGKKLDDILGGRKTVSEGVTTVKAVYAIAQERKIKMPICDAVYAILYDGIDIDTAIQTLLSRPFIEE
ncbi:MAG: NAD(P)H-dependent glycerol-3-phosphate dehydrogenase [Alphaproteobacteria bacterium]